MICKAKLVDLDLLQEAKFIALQNNVETCKVLSNAALSKAKAKFEVYQKKRFKAIQLIWDFQHRDKTQFNEFKNLLQSHSFYAQEKTSIRRSLLLQQNPGIFLKTNSQGSSVNVNQDFITNRRSQVLLNGIFRVSKKIKAVNWAQSGHESKDQTIQSDALLFPIDRRKVFNQKQRSSMNINDQNTVSPPSRFGGAQSASVKNYQLRRGLDSARNINPATSYYRFRAKNGGILPHNRLPDIAPVIPIEDSLKYMFTNARFNRVNKLGQSKQDKIISARQGQVSCTIEGFEKMFASQEIKQKKHNAFQKDVELFRDMKFDKCEKIRSDAKVRQQGVQESIMLKSISDYKQLLTETDERIRQVNKMTKIRSRSHQSQIHSDRVRREQLADEKIKKDELRVKPALIYHRQDMEEHGKRAQSARAIFRSKLEERDQFVKQTRANFNERRTGSALQQLTKSIADRETVEKKISQRQLSYKEQSEIVRDRSQIARGRFESVSQHNMDLRSKSCQKISDKLQKMDRQVSERNLRQDEKLILHQTENESRMEDNARNNAIQQQQLEMIKERVKRKYIKTLTRRQLQSKLFTPPTTYDIYMQQQQLNSRTQQNFFGNAAQKINLDPNSKTPAQSTYKEVLTPQHYRMPSSDFSLKLAMQSTYDFTIKKLKKRRLF